MERYGNLVSTPYLVDRLKPVRQNGPGMCAQACVEMVVKACDPTEKFSQTHLFELVADKNRGTEFNEIVELTHIYFSDVTSKSEWNLDSTVDVLNKGHVFISNWWDTCDYGDNDPEDGHYSVIGGVDLVNDRLLVFDPSQRKTFLFKGEKYVINGMSVIPLSWFLERWYDFDDNGVKIERWGMAINPGSYIKK